MNYCSDNGAAAIPRCILIIFKYIFHSPGRFSERTDSRMSFNRKRLTGFQLHMLRSEQHSFKVLQIREQYLTENSNNCFFFWHKSYFILKHEPARRYRQRIHDVSSSCFQTADQIFPYLRRKQINYDSFSVFHCRYFLSVCIINV